MRVSARSDSKSGISAYDPTLAPARISLMRLTPHQTFVRAGIYENVGAVALGQSQDWGYKKPLRGTDAAHVEQSFKC